MDNSGVINKIKNDQMGILIFFSALGLRILFAAFLKKYYFFYNFPSSDVLYYRQWAMEIAHQSFLGTKTFWGLPLYPYFLAMLHNLFLGHLELVRFAHLLLGAINCVFAYRIAQNIFSKKTGVLTGILMATNFTLIFYDWIMMPVPLLIFLSLLTLHCFLNLKTTHSIFQLFMLGLLLGVTTLGDGKMLIFAIMCFLFIIFFNLQEKKIIHFKKTIIIFSGMALILGAVSLRNKFFAGDYIFISAQSGLSFFVGNNEKAQGYFENPSFIRPMHGGQDEDQILMAQQLSGKKLTDKQVSKFWKNKGMNFIQKHPLQYLVLIGKKLKLFASENQNAFDMDLLFLTEYKERLELNPYGIIFPLAFIGILLSFRQAYPGKGYLNLLIFSQLIITLIYFMTNRHRATIYPFLFMYESVAVLWIVQQMKNRQWKYAIISLLIICAHNHFFPTIYFEKSALDFLVHAKTGPIREKQGALTEAKNHYFEALKIRPQDTNTLYNLGNTYFQEKNYPEAIKTYETVLKINPIQIDALYNLAMTYQTIDQTDTAIDFYKKVLALSPTDISTYYNLAKISIEKDRCMDAKGYAEDILKINPGFSQEVQQLINPCKP